MPNLNWIGKEAVVNHDKDVPFKLLKKIESASVGKESQNLIIHGDNLEGLKALMPYYTGKIKCIYIDPPYNTGNESWIYNDKVNSPKINKWFGKTVGTEKEDLCRHDKWLCMMYPRLKLLKDLLREDGILLISIDDNEDFRLQTICNELFGENNFIAKLIRQTRKGGGSMSKYISSDHEYLLMFTKNISELERIYTPYTKEYLKRYKEQDKKGRYFWDTYVRNRQGTANFYKINAPDGTVLENAWINPKHKFEELLKEGEIRFKKTKTGGWSVQIKQRMNENGQIMRSLILDYPNRLATISIKELFGKNVFPYSKPYQFIKYLINSICDKSDFILDSFAGSGTTAHAVLDLNNDDEGNRKFILIEMEDKIAKNITAERVKRAIKKYDYKAGFEYCELDKPLFDENRQIEETCDFNQFATYIYFTETQTNIDKKKIDKNFIGEFNNIEYYLIYKDKFKNVLTKPFLSKLKNTKSKKIIYADKCLVDLDLLEKLNIQFKQIPYEVKEY